MENKDKNVTWVKLGELIQETNNRNSELKFDLSDVRGMTITKEVIPTKANLSGNDLKKFLIVNPYEFIYNPRTHGKRIGLGFNDINKPFIISWNNISFRIIDTNRLLPLYLFLYFNRSEWDREACFNSWGSSTEVFSWNALCEMEIPLPSMKKQIELASVWKGLKDLSAENDAIAEPLEQLCRSYMQKLKHSAPMSAIGNFISPFDIRNKEKKDFPILGINKEKRFMPTVANTKGLDTSKYKVIRKGQFVFSGMQTGRDVCIRIALYDDDDPALLSPAYSTFTVNSNNLLPEFLFMCFKRSEMDRYGWFISDSSVRSNLDWTRFLDIEIPLPSLEQQEAIVSLYKCASKSRKIAEQARKLSYEVCPALMQKAIRG